MAFLLQGGCASLEDQVAPAEELTSKAMERFGKGNYYSANEIFNTIKEHYPFTRFSLLAELKSADCKYYQDEYEEALKLYAEFEKNHPTNEAMPYVLFQVGRSHFLSLSTIDRDPGQATETISSLARLLKTYPNSPYTEEAKVLIDKSRNFLADHELYVANFYFRTKEVGQAEKRARELAQVYPGTEAAQKALELLKKIESLPTKGERSPELTGEEE
ncbi:MAG: outer membrane protein assembly factor BamD [Proteobacteria bacterium]|nr:outer membrane protein assembly factor BamD [Pseudomonadota bacterium]